MASIAIYILIFVVSLAVLLLSSDKFIDAAERIGLSFGVSPFIIGITIVAFGTSLPELATSIASVLNGSSEIVIGNVVGSNITNILLVLGLTAMIGKDFKLDFNIMDVDMPLLIISAFLTYYLVWDLDFSMFDAFISLAALSIFLANSVQGQQVDKDDRPILAKVDYLWLIGGAVGVFAGANYVIYAIENISQIMAISPDLIALTLVALGTSLPEIVVSISAARKGKHAIAVGNVLGSNIFNSYAVMGIPRLFGPLAISESVLSFSIPFMIVMTILFAIITFSNRISRYEGMMLVLFYVYYIVQLVQNNG